MKITYFLLFFFVFSSFVITKAMAESGISATLVAPSSYAYIVYTEHLPEGVDPESHHLGTLSTVLGSDESAKDALIYVYKTTVTGFSVNLTPKQVSELSKQPGVLQVIRSKTYQLYSGSGGAGMSNMGSI